MRSTIFNLFFYSYSFYIAAKLYIIAVLSGRREALYPTIKEWGETTMRAVDIILGAKIEIRGWEKIPRDRPLLFVSKHQSELDVVLLAVLMPNVGAVAMEELTKYPFFGKMMKTLDVVLVAVDGGPQNRTEQSVEGAQRTFEQDRPMIIYPEGELMSLGAKERYRRGAAHIYTRLRPRAIPVATSVGVVWPRREWRKNPGLTGAIEFLEPLPDDLDFDTFMAEAERVIEDNTMRLIREHAPAPMLAEAETRKARNATNNG
ncbi:MAG: lysophospholipid acyltransferase family protein [Pseudomonadota bacterium]